MTDEYDKSHQVDQSLGDVSDVDDWGEDDWGDDEDESKSPTATDDFEDYKVRRKQRIKRTIQQTLRGVSTGIHMLDEAIGGIRGLSFLAGRTGSGKTSFSVQTSLAGMKADPSLGLLYFALDDTTKDDIFDAMICNEARVDLKKYVSFEVSDEEKARVNESQGFLRDNIWHRTRIIDRRALMAILRERASEDFQPGLDAAQIAEHAFELQRCIQAPRVLTVIDLFQKMPLPISGQHRNGDHGDYYRLCQIEAFRDFTKDFCPDGWPILAVSSTRKRTGGRDLEQNADDVYGSVDLGYEATQVLLLQTDDSSRDEDRQSVASRISVLKCRSGHKAVIPLTFHYPEVRFEIADAHESARVVPRAPGSGELTLDSSNDL